MRQRGRKSGAGLGILQVDGKPNRLNPPASLSTAERAIFFDVVAACDRDHFRPSDLPLLVRYIEAAALGDQAAEQLRLGAVINGKPSPWIIGHLQFAPTWQQMLAHQLIGLWPTLVFLFGITFDIGFGQFRKRASLPLGFFLSGGIFALNDLEHDASRQVAGHRQRE